MREFHIGMYHKYHIFFDFSLFYGFMEKQLTLLYSIQEITL